jgi:Rps23 Pro-64 3,4-dihydroxylase Tpa1-like proline 4-hydroxylase
VNTNKVINKKFFNLEEFAKENRNKYLKAKPFPHIILENFFKTEYLNNALSEFPDLTLSKKTEMYENKNEIKLANNNLKKFPRKIKDVIKFLNSKKFRKFLQNITSIKENLIADNTLSGGGLHEIKRGGILKIHTDFNRHPFLKLDRRINLLLYLNKNWKKKYDGNLEFWDQDMLKCKKKVLPIFNRMVIFSTTDFSNHGHPTPLNCPKNKSRKSIAIYYFSKGRPNSEIKKTHQKNTTLFKNRANLKNDVFIKSDKIKNYLRSFKIYHRIKNFEKMYLRIGISKKKRLKSK